MQNHRAALFIHINPNCTGGGSWKSCDKPECNIHFSTLSYTQNPPGRDCWKRRRDQTNNVNLLTSIRLLNWHIFSISDRMTSVGEKTI